MISQRPLFLVLPWLVLVLQFLSACANSELPEAKRGYQTKKDYESLEVLCRHLRTGMAQSEVRELLGEPEYSPIAGQEYYSSNLRKTDETSGATHIVGLIMEYRDTQGRPTKQVQSFRLAPIGE